MLVLSRRESDQVVIPSMGITLQVLSIKGNVVKLGIDAPQSIRVLRGELADQSEQLTIKKRDCRPVQGAKDGAKRQKTVAGSAPLRAYVREVRAVAQSVDPSNDSVRETRPSYEVCV